MNKLTPEQTAYIAGIIDGEGTITILTPLHKKSRTKKAKIRYEVTISAVNTKKTLLDYLYACTGVGLVKHRKDKKERRRPVWDWTLRSNHKCLALLYAIRPYLVIKGPQAQLAIGFIETCFRKQTSLIGYTNPPLSVAEIEQRNWYVKEIRKLNQRWTPNWKPEPHPPSCEIPQLLTSTPPLLKLIQK